MIDIIQDAIDGAQLVQAREYGAGLIVQVWHGGTTVNVWVVDPGGAWENTNCWNLSDDYGRPVDRDAIDEHMEMHFEQIVGGGAGR